MKLYAAIYEDTDVYTYWADIYLGVFDSRPKADECILKESESGKYSWRKLEDYRVHEFELNEVWE